MAAAPGRVSEWMQRKAKHAVDPMELLKKSARHDREGTSISGASTVARAGKGVVLARSSHVQTVNRRAYFPLESCVLEHFLPSDKRWR